VTRVKLCCMRDAREVELAIAAGADVLGFVGEQPSGPGRLTDEAIAPLIAQVAGRARTWLLTAATSLDAVRDQLRRTGPSGVQLCDHVDDDVHAGLRRDFPDLHVVQVIHAGESDAVEQALATAPHVHALLLDSGVTTGPDRQLGGTGRTHDWSLSRRIVDAVDAPVWLAGGLRPDNVETAIRQVRPHGVDLCSGVRDGDYALDEDQVTAFMAAVRTGSARLQLPPDASLAQLQHYVHQLEAHHDWLNLSVVDNGFLMTEEVGELHAALRHHQRALQRGDADAAAATKQEVAHELVDVLNYLLAQANRLGIDVEAAFREKNGRNLDRSWE